MRKKKSFKKTLGFHLPQLLMISTFPPRECGIATYAQDLITAINDRFTETFEIQVCALENGSHRYSSPVKYILETEKPNSYDELIKKIVCNNKLQWVVIQHEFGLFRNNDKDFLRLLSHIDKPVAVVFHTVLPKPDKELQAMVQSIAGYTHVIIVMTETSRDILQQDYLITEEKIKVIPHGTHLIKHKDKQVLKEKYGSGGRKILSTFGLLSSGKSLETTLNALPAIVSQHPSVLFLILGKTHPSVVKQEGEKYRESLEGIVEKLKLKDHVQFVNKYLPLDTLLDYLQLTDIYLFTSKDPGQAVSGTFSYAIGCGCPVISTPIPHACEVLKNDCGIIIGFNDTENLAIQVNRLLNDESIRNRLAMNGLHHMAATAWENSALQHVRLFKNMVKGTIRIHYKIPAVKLDHLQDMTTDFGILQFSVLNRPDRHSGYTLDDNARALILMCQHFEVFKQESDLAQIQRYLDFIRYCYHGEGRFFNYVDFEKEFTAQNGQDNLEDSVGRAVWACGYLLSLENLLPQNLVADARIMFNESVEKSVSIHSTRAMAFIIKGIYFANRDVKHKNQLVILELLADRLIQMYRHEADSGWQWFESYLTYANSVIPEAMLLAWRITGKDIYRATALSSFSFLLSRIFFDKRIKVISNRGWLHNGQEINKTHQGGEQAIDVAYTILALGEFYESFKTKFYREKIMTAFSWFLGHNHLNQIVYNPRTGGCYDGVEDHYINLNQGAESTLCYLLARLALERHNVLPTENRWQYVLPKGLSVTR